MIFQFFSKPFWIAFATLMSAFVFSMIAYTFHLAPFFLGIFGLITLMLTRKNPTHGLLIVFLELFSNPHGHLLFFDTGSFTLSLRMTIFVGFFLGYAFFLLKNKPFARLKMGDVIVFFPLLFAVFCGLFFGMLFQNPSAVFQDSNAYFFFAYLIPILSHRWTPSDQRLFLQTLGAGVIWNMLASLILLYLFSHLGDVTLHPVYVFLRDIRLAEITRAGTGFYRIFIQTQFFVIVFGAFLIPLLPQMKKRKDRLLVIFLLGAVWSIVLISLSRSFWVGIFCALIILFILLLKQKLSMSSWKEILVGGFLSLFISLCLILTTVFFPWPPSNGNSGHLSDVILGRTRDDAAISSRYKLLDPMLTLIQQRPIFGNGFGAEVSFHSDDPRVLAQFPDGFWSTYSLEWGWLELWLKMGLLGPIGFLILFGYLIRRFFPYLKTDQAWIGLGFITSLIFLFVTHTFSPYLNHPIGLGFILFALVFLPTRQSPQTVPFTVTQEHRGNLSKMPEPASAISLQLEQK